MDDECELLGEPDTPQIVEKRVFEIMEALSEGSHVDSLTERDVKNVEEVLQKITSSLEKAKKSMLTEEDILNVANLNFRSPHPSKSANSMKEDFDFSSPLRDASPPNADDDRIELDYEESINGNISDSDSERGGLQIDTGSDSDDEKPAKIQKNLRKIGKTLEAPPLKIVKHHILASNPAPKKVIKEEEIIILSSSSESESETDSAVILDELPKKRARIVFDLEDKKPVKKVKREEEMVEINDDINVSKANFSKKLTKEEPYLKLRKSQMSVDSRRLGLTYPLGVTFDKPSDTWFITNQPFQSDGGTGYCGKSKVVKIYVGKDKKKEKYTDIIDKMIDNPMAITVYKEGSQIAVLCSDDHKKPSIRLINHRKDDRVSTFCTWRTSSLDFTYACRGLARTKGGNLLTTDRPFNGPPRLRIFSKRSDSRVEETSFMLKKATVPSFIASSGTTVVVTDLGTPQTVMHFKIDDTDWRNVTFETLQIITTTGVNLRAEEMLNSKFFIYVSGVQIDKNGNIIIADAKNHHFKLFHPSMEFINRISTDFPVPYVSSFHVNQYGECLILSTRETNKVHFAKLTATNRIEKHIKSGCNGRIGVKNPLSSKKRLFPDDSD